MNQTKMLKAIKMLMMALINLLKFQIRFYNKNQISTIKIILTAIKIKI